MHEAANDQSLGTKNVLTSALRFAMSVETLTNPLGFAHELKTSAQEQVEFMLAEDKEALLMISDEEVRSVVKSGISEVLWTLLDGFSSLLPTADLISEFSENGVLQTLSDIEWLCKVLPKMELMKDLVSKWADISGKILAITENCKFDSRLWGVKVKLVEVTGKVLEAVGYGTVILPCVNRVCLMKTWLPFIRRLKHKLDTEGSQCGFKMDEDLCECIEGSMVSLVLTLPSKDQAEVLGEWMRGIESDRVKFPDLSEAFEVWCYRTKSSKRRLLERCDRLASLNLSHL